ncbi:metallophosphoesterase [Pararhizobium sp. BT-229]|uniref:metallophosphoesterase family protein n=1 Tax=Pararhizobium sp. BT-229 TaxID=2986923 RepID=UPI0021F6DF0C|nr:metallophosphoesterase [Pararhizobium sp. BT-229]MCV9967249.1 metallophosphoesterase [Pararhizobium sp. BT-229]
MKIVQITDTHLSPNKTHFNGNWEPLLDWIFQTGADLVIHTGDLTVDGADQEDDITFSMDLMRQLSMPVLIVPGNHDVGHLPGSDQPVDAARLERWRRLAGPDYWVSDHGNWRLIGLNSLLLGHGDTEEAAQFTWLEEVLAARDGRRVAIFTHKPLFVDDAHEGDTGYWSIRPAPRQRLYDLLAAHDVALFASGHLHWAWKGTLENTALVWGPSSAFIIDKLEREMPGERVVGAVIHTLGEEVMSEIVALPALTPHYIDEVIDEVYPRSASSQVEAAQ